ncbi:MAG: hypothetical protein LJE75_13395 [Gammaproteobacteria bacterium]|jgi:hypothetical protein|nr:hypothetical protein [Gammaproteobacteria bacterium]
MTVLDTVLIGMLAGIITLKVTLLASAAVLLVCGMSGQVRQRRGTPVVLAAKHPGLDGHA